MNFLKQKLTHNQAWMLHYRQTSHYPVEYCYHSSASECPLSEHIEEADRFSKHSLEEKPMVTPIVKAWVPTYQKNGEKRKYLHKTK